MRTRIMSIAALAIAVLVGGCCNPGIIGSQPVALRPQETSMWCWAASGQMCMEFLGTRVEQCDEANKRFGHTDCCNTPVPNDCIEGGWPEFEKYGFTQKVTSWGTALTWDQLKDQIYCQKKPFCFSWGWSGGGGHMMVAIGYVTLNGTNYVVVNNPWAPNVGAQQTITYDEFVSGGDHVHWVDYYDITRK